MPLPYDGKEMLPAKCLCFLFSNMFTSPDPPYCRVSQPPSVLNYSLLPLVFSIASYSPIIRGSPGDPPEISCSFMVRTVGLKQIRGGRFSVMGQET